jgi:hypothetical protein
MNAAVTVAPISPLAGENGGAYGSRPRDVSAAKRGGKAKLCQDPPLGFASDFRFAETGLRSSPPQGGRRAVPWRLRHDP